MGPAQVTAGAILLLFGLRYLRLVALRIPDNVPRLAAGAALSAMGMFWFGEGVGIGWPLGDVAIVALLALLFAASGAAARFTHLRRTAGPPPADDGTLVLTIGLILVVTGLAASTPWFDDRILAGLFATAIVAALLENVVRSARANTA